MPILQHSRQPYNPSMQDLHHRFLTLSPNRLHWLSATIFVLALVAACWRAPSLPSGTFVPPAVRPSALPPLFQQQMLPGVGGSANAPSLTLLADGRLAIAWLSVAETPHQHDTIWFSIRNDGNWTEPYPVITSDEAAGSLFAHIRKIGDPVLFSHDGRLHLWLTANGAAGRSIVHTSSSDGGRTWRGLSRLTVSPLTETDLHQRSAPVPLSDGGLALPISPSLISRQVQWLGLDASGRILAKHRQGSATPPHWQPDRLPAAAHPDIPLAVLPLADGRLLGAGNTAAGRGTLALWMGNANGSVWQGPYIIESASDAHAEFSEPSLAIDHEGRIHVAYGWRGQGIRHLVFSESWLAGGRQ